MIKHITAITTSHDKIFRQMYVIEQAFKGYFLTKRN